MMLLKLMESEILIIFCSSLRNISKLYTNFLFSEDTDEARRACIRVNNPPGGRSAGGFW